MPHIDTTPPESASGLLAKIYGEASARTGKVFQILQTMSPNPVALEASVRLYVTIMFGRSGLSRARREMLATVVSRANDCFY